MFRRPRQKASRPSPSSEWGDDSASYRRVRQRLSPMLQGVSELPLVPPPSMEAELPSFMSPAAPDSSGLVLAAAAAAAAVNNVMSLYSSSGSNPSSPSSSSSSSSSAAAAAAAVIDHTTRFVAIYAEKGGSCKTTVAVHLAHELVRQGKSVLLVDADPQANVLAKFFNATIARRLQGTTVEQFIFEKQCEVQPIQIDGVHIVRGLPPDQALEDCWIDTMNKNLKENTGDDLLRFMRQVRERSAQYDVVIFDMNPGITDPVNQLLLMMVGTVISPLSVDNDSLESNERLCNQIVDMKARFGDLAGEPTVWLFPTRIPVSTRRGDDTAKPLRKLHKYLRSVRNRAQQFEVMKFGGFVPLLHTDILNRPTHALVAHFGQRKARLPQERAKLLEAAMQKMVKCIELGSEEPEAVLEEQIVPGQLRATRYKFSDIEGRRMSVSPGNRLLFWLHVPGRHGQQAYYTVGCLRSRRLDQGLRRHIQGAHLDASCTVWVVEAQADVAKDLVKKLKHNFHRYVLPDSANEVPKKWTKKAPKFARSQATDNVGAQFENGELVGLFNECLEM